MWQAQVRIDLDAIRHNVATLRGLLSPRTALMSVVKADAYGHGLLPVADAAVQGGAAWLGTATLDEALALRRHGVTVPVLSWLHSPGRPLHEGVEAGVDLSASSVDALDEIVAGARQVSAAARVHLKVDTGMSRGGAGRDDWPALLTAAAKAQADGDVEIVAVWSHLACADEPGHPSIVRQQIAFDDALDVASALGVEPPLRHLANSAAALTLPESHFELARVGLATYGLSPIPGAGPDLRPAMSVHARVALVKPVRAGEGVSYGHTYKILKDTKLALVPVGYGDGVPRSASSRASVLLGGRVRRVIGRVCMDQIIVDCGDDDVHAGDEAVLFGPGAQGEPTADDWAAAADTINYEIVTRMGSDRAPRVYVGERSMTGTDVDVVKGSRRRKVGIIGAILGVAAAGVAAGVATERYLVQRSKRADDAYADEEFGVWDFDEELTVTTDDGIDLHVEIVDGPGAQEGAPTLVFVHGFCLDMGTFHFQRKALEGKHRMVFYDQPGHGRSGRLAKGEYTLDALGAGLRAVLQATAPSGPVVLIGHSMGGMTIMALAEQVPELFESRVEAVVLIATSAGKLDQVNFGLPEVVAKFRRPLLPVIGLAAPISSGVVDRARRASTDLAWLLTRRYGFGTARPSPALVSYVEKMNTTTSTDVIARYLRTLYTHARLLVLGPLRRVPVLLVCGDRDVLTPLTHTREIAAVLPEAELVVVSEGGHVVMLEHADEVNEAMETFLKRVLTR